MKIKRPNLFFVAAAAFAAVSSAHAATAFFDGGTTDIAVNGDGVSQAITGNWNTTTQNWDLGVSTHAAWLNTSSDIAVFGGFTSSTVTVASVNVGVITASNASSANSRLTFQNGTFTFGSTGVIDGSGTQSTGTAGLQLTSMTLAGVIANGLTLKGGSVNGTAAQAYSALFNAINPTRVNNLVMNAAVSGTFTGAITINNGVEMQNNSTGTRYAHLGAATNNVILSEGTLYLYTAGAASATFDHNINVVGTNNALNMNNGSAPDLTISGNLTSASSSDTLWSVTQTVGSDAGQMIYTGDLTGFTGTFRAKGSATSATVIDSASTFGGTFRVESGILQIGNNDTKGSFGTNNIVNNGTIKYSRTDAQTYAGDISGTGGLTVSTGTLTLSGTNTYLGTTSVGGGKLILNGSLAGTSIIVDAGGTLGGSGTFGGTVTVNGTLAPGNSIGTQNFSQTLTLAGTANFEIDPTLGFGLNSDLANVAGSLTYGGVLNVTYGGPASNFSEGMVFNLFDASSTSGNFSSVTLPDLTGTGLSWQNNLATTGTLSVIPEPSAALLGGIGMLLIFRRRRA